MNSNNNIQNKIEETLSSLDGMQRATPGPHFFTRVHARLYQSRVTVWDRWSSFLTRPSIALATSLLIVLGNVYIAMDVDTTDGSVGATQSYQVLADEYNNIAATGFYELENMTPDE